MLDHGWQRVAFGPGPGGGGGGTLTPENFEQAFRASHPEVASHLGATTGGPEGGAGALAARLGLRPLAPGQLDEARRRTFITPHLSPFFTLVALGNGWHVCVARQANGELEQMLEQLAQRGELGAVGGELEQMQAQLTAHPRGP